MLADTRYSGITRKMLKHVHTRIEDVQQRIQQLLPSDAILVGHSLNFDLDALQVNSSVDTHLHTRPCSMKQVLFYCQSVWVSVCSYAGVSFEVKFVQESGVVRLWKVASF